MRDIVRVFRIIEYVGPRDLIEEQIRKSVHGTKTVVTRYKGLTISITAATIGEFPEILARTEQDLADAAPLDKQPPSPLR